MMTTKAEGMDLVSKEIRDLLSYLGSRYIILTMSVLTYSSSIHTAYGTIPTKLI